MQQNAQDQKQQSRPAVRRIRLFSILSACPFRILKLSIDKILRLIAISPGPENQYYHNHTRI